MFTNGGSMSSLNIALFELSDTHVLVYTFSFSYHFEFSYSSTCPLYMGNLIMSPTLKISLVVLSLELKAALGHLCVVLTIQGIIHVSAYYPDYIIILSNYYLCLPFLIQFLVTLMIRWRIYCLPHHSLFSHHHLLNMKT